MTLRPMIVYPTTRISAFRHRRAQDDNLASLWRQGFHPRTDEGDTMARDDLTRLTGNAGGPNCDDDDCPNVYRTKSGAFVVQGEVSHAFTPRGGEGLVEIPEAVLREAFRALGW